MAEIKVKKLVWEERLPNMWYAQSFFGDYRIFEQNGTWYHKPSYMSSYIKKPTLDLAKQACEDHWVNGVKFCLVPQETGGGRAE